MNAFQNIYIPSRVFAIARVGTRELQEQLCKLNKSAQVIQDQADLENRPLSPGEQRELQGIFDEFEDVERRLKIASQAENLSRSQGRMSDPVDPFNNSGNYPGAFDAQRQPGRAALPAPLRAPGVTPENSGWTGPTARADFALAVREASRISGNIDPRLVMNAPTTVSTEGVGADGGFAVPPDFQNEIWQKVGGEDSLLSRTDTHTTTKNTMVFPSDETTPWDTSGGIQAYWESESAQLNQSKVALKSKETRLNKLTVLVPVTEELLEDAPSLNAYLQKKVGEKMDFKVTLKILTGSGVGEPLGILNSPSLITVPKVTSPAQPAATILSNNIEAMWSALYNPWRRNSVWIINQDCESQLSQLVIRIPNAANTDFVGGWPLYYPQGSIAGSPYATLKGRPVLYSQACSQIGTPGDIILVDLKQYLTATKTQGIRADVSMHLWFDYDVMAFRFIFRCAGQPWWAKPITPLNDSTNLLSYAAVLAQRS
jgi:HK97 family phage major capsid protein